MSSSQNDQQYRIAGIDDTESRPYQQDWFSADPPNYKPWRLSPLDDRTRDQFYEPEIQTEQERQTTRTMVQVAWMKLATGSSFIGSALLLSTFGAPPGINLMITGTLTAVITVIAMVLTGIHRRPIMRLAYGSSVLIAAFIARWGYLYQMG